ncbi:MAG: hypothetical protein ACI4RD_09830 [Kiritimatiellia bacterium]
MKCGFLLLGVGLVLAASAETFEFAAPPGCRTAVTVGETVAVTPLDADVFRAEVAARPVRQADGSVRLTAEKPVVVFLPGRTANVAKYAHVTVSSRGDASRGFQPIPGLNEPSSLVDGKVHRSKNFTFAARQTAPSAADPDWIALDWKKPFPLAGLCLMTGDGEALPTGASLAVERYVGVGDPRLDAASGSWQSVPGAWTAAKTEPAAGKRGWAAWTATSPVKGRAFRLLFTGPSRRLDGHGGERPLASLGEIAVLMPWTGAAEGRTKQTVRGTVEIPFKMPFAGTATVQVRDAAGRVVANPVVGEAFAAGEQRAVWDLVDLDGKVLLQPGTYSWKGIALPPLRLDYRYAYYPCGLPDDRRPWVTEDKTGGWLADHDPPRGVVRDGETMWLNAWAECGDSVIRTDLDLRKLWGQTRFWVAVPQEICTDGGFVYGYSQGGWNGPDEEIIRIDPSRGFQSKKVLLKKNPQEDGKRNAFFDTSVSGFQVLGDRAFVALGRENRIAVYDIAQGNAAPYRPFSWATVHKQFDELKPVLLKEIPLPLPGRLRRYGAGRLITTSGRDVLTLDTATYETRRLFSVDFDQVLGLGVGDDGTIWIGAGEPLHQVFGYDAGGRLLRTLGKPGKRKIGPWDDNDLEEPSGVEVDARGRVWVTEHTHWEKRVSVWDAKRGVCVRQVLGPTQYGGDGCIDPENETRLFYRGLELRRNPRTGEVKPVNLIYRPDAPEYPPFAASDYPSYCFRANGRLWFTSFQHPHGHPQLVLWQYQQTHVMPVAALGAVRDFKDAFGGKGSITNAVPGLTAAPGLLYTWTDANDNGRIDADEVRTRTLAYDGKPIPGLGVGWNWRMNARFECACMTDIYTLGRMVYFKPSGFTAKGYPRYEIPSETVPGVLEAQGVQTDAQGNVIALGRHVVSLRPDGSERWRYRNEWPGLHAGHRTTAAGDEPGVLIAPTRMWGVVPTAGEAGEVAAFNSNLGCAYLMTADDGLYLGRVFRDQRVAPTLWNMNGVPDATTMAETSLYDEHFGGGFQRVRGSDGRFHYYYVVGKGHCAVVELTGLDQAKRLSGGVFTVTAEAIEQAHRRVAELAAARLEPKLLTVAKGRPDDAAPAAEQIRLGYDAENLYVSSRWRDDRAPFANAGANPFELFTSGDTLEVLLRTGKDADARGIQPGDIRLVFAPFGGKTVCVLYDYRVPGTAKAARVGFASPWRTVYVDRVAVLERAVVTVERKGAEVRLEAQVPLADIHFTPRGDVKGDVGRVLSDATGTRAAARTYWSNKNTAIMSDLPTEVGIEPDLWGTLRFGDSGAE